MKINPVKIWIQDEIDKDTDDKTIRKGLVYKITNKNGLEYIGSTVKKLGQRFSMHKRDYKRHVKSGWGTFSACYLLLDDDFQSCKIEKIADVYFIGNKDFLRQTEEKYRLGNKKCVNYKKCYRTKEEAREYQRIYESNKRATKKLLSAAVGK